MFASLLKQLRAKKGVSQLELAKAIGVSNGNVGDWERGRSKPGYDALIALSRFFEVSAGRLMKRPPGKKALFTQHISKTKTRGKKAAHLWALIPEMEPLNFWPFLI